MKFAKNLTPTIEFVRIVKNKVQQEGEDFHDEIEIEECGECGKQFHNFLKG